MNTHRTLISLDAVGVDYKPSRSIFRHGTAYTALHSVTFDILAGDSVGIIGRNGAGKSTLLKIISGIIDPDRGKLINHNASTSLLSLQTGFDPALPGLKNIYLSGLLLGFSKKNINAQLEQIIEFSELGNFINKPVQTYSAGMRARLGFSIAFQLKPDILLIDEVLGVGDYEFRQKSSRAMREKIKSDQTVILVSHDTHTVKNLCHKVVWIENGVVKAQGTPEQVLENYEEYIAIHPPKM